MYIVYPTMYNYMDQEIEPSALASLTNPFLKVASLLKKEGRGRLRPKKSAICSNEDVCEIFIFFSYIIAGPLQNIY